LVLRTWLCGKRLRSRAEALACAVALGSVVYLMKSDVRTGATTLRRNMKVIRGWMEEQGAAAQQCALHTRAIAGRNCTLALLAVQDLALGMRTSYRLLRMGEQGQQAGGKASWRADVGERKSG